MKKKVVTLLLALTMAGSLIACGSEAADSESKNPAAEVKEETKENEPVEEDEATPEVSEEKKADENEEWGVYEELSIISSNDKGIPISVRFPSMVPVYSGRVNYAYQMDPTLTMIGWGGTEYIPDSFENAFETYFDAMIYEMNYYRQNVKYKDFAFTVDTKEAVTINDFPMYKYTGTHSFTISGEAYEIPYVAYSIDLQVEEGAYMFVGVMDESVLHTERPAVEEGVIEEYAYQMANSVKIRDVSFHLDL